jgi:F-type H+-transporting ATPase subunit a
MFPLNVIGKLSSIISSSFRLFGNIFGGSIITKLYFTAIQTSLLTQLFGIFSGFNILIVLFFTLFEGLLQAFVFAMLTLTFLSLGASDESSH